MSSGGHPARLSRPLSPQCPRWPQGLRATVAAVILAVVGLKGGVGKSSLAALLAQAAARTGRRVLLVDADPQASVVSWAEDAAGLGEDVTVVALPMTRLDRELRRLTAGFDEVVIDTPPGRGELGIVNAAARASDLVLVPMAPTLLDLDRLRPTLAVAEEQGTPAVVVVNKARAGTRSTRDVLEALGEVDDVAVLDTVVPLTERIAGAVGRRSVPAPIPDLWAELVAIAEALDRG